MAVIVCADCNKLTDADHIEIHDTEDGLICDTCFLKREDELMRDFKYFKSQWERAND